MIRLKDHSMSKVVTEVKLLKTLEGNVLMLLFCRWMVMVVAEVKLKAPEEMSVIVL